MGSFCGKIGAKINCTHVCSSECCIPTDNHTSNTTRQHVAYIEEIGPRRNSLYRHTGGQPNDPRNRVKQIILPS